MPFHISKLSHISDNKTAKKEGKDLQPVLSNDPPSYDDSIHSSSSHSNTVTPIATPSNGGRLSPAPAITGNSSSSILRSVKSNTHQNKPYRPSKEQQGQIDLLNGINSLSSVSSGAQTEYFDVLPSFQMFQSILKRDDSQFSENLLIDPPVYGDTTHSSPTPPRSPPGRSGNENTNNVMDSVSQRLSDYGLGEDNSRPYEEEEENFLFSDEDPQPDGSNANNQTGPAEGVSTHETYGHTVLDNIDRLPQLNTSPIDIQIVVAKGVPQANAATEAETRLKEYTSGDLVNGYIIITNKSDKPVDFGLFTVSLEGTIKATERDLNISDFTLHKFKKVLIKKFLKMYDLNASYGYTHIPNSAGIEYEAFTNDEYDGCQLGLPDERILLPHVKYKKFFTFKFPTKLLDNNCVDNLLPHNLPPPSMGLDKTCFYNRGDTIQLNKALGYGFLNVRGTPLLTRDYAFDDVSISYTIEAKFIDKLDADNQDPLSQHEINDPNSDSNYVISKHNQYFLRFIPDLREQLEYFNQGYQLLTSTYETMGIDGKLFQNYIQLSSWRAIHELNSQIEREIDVKLASEELSIEEMKHKNLLIENRDFTTNTINQLDLKDHITRQIYYDRGNSWEMDDMLEYQDKRMISNKVPISVFGKKKKKILSSLVYIGKLRLYVKVPSKIFPYSSPKLLMKYNTPPEDNGAGIHSAITGQSVASSESLKPTSSIASNMLNIYHRKDNLTEVEIELVFEPNNNSNKPPLISQLETNLVFWSFNTEYPLPIEMNYDFFYKNGEKIEVKNPEASEEDDVEITRKNLQALKDQAKNYINFLKVNKTFISKSSFLYLKAIKSLGIKKDIIKEYFETLTLTTHNSLLNDESGWQIKQLPNQKFRYIKKLTIPLTTINKNNITLLPSFQSCLVGRIYCLQVVVKYKGSGGDQNEFADNIVRVDVPILVG